MNMLLASPFSIPIVAIAGVFIWLSIVAISEATTAAKKHQADVDLKRTLAQQGMSPEEIAMVVQAGRDGAEAKGKSAPKAHAARNDAFAQTVAHPPTKHARSA
jgi:hypothetical protein